MDIKSILSKPAGNYAVEKGRENPEVRTTVDPASYNISRVVSLHNQVCVLENGSKWQIDSNQNVFAVGDQVQLVDRNRIKNLETGDFVRVSFLELPALESNVIQQIQWVRWAGEVQAWVTLKDGSKWFFDEFTSHRVVEWKEGDRVLVFQLDESAKGAWRNDCYYVSNMDLDCYPPRSDLLLFLSSSYARLAEYSLDSEKLEYQILDTL